MITIADRKVCNKKVPRGQYWMFCSRRGGRLGHFEFMAGKRTWPLSKSMCITPKQTVDYSAAASQTARLTNAICQINTALLSWLAWNVKLARSKLRHCKLCGSSVANSKTHTCYLIGKWPVKSINIILHCAAVLPGLEYAKLAGSKIRHFELF